MAVALSVVCLLASCGRLRDIGEQRFMPREPGVLTVATSLPAPGFWNGDDVDHLSGGFEFGVATRLADRFGLRLRVVDVAFDRLVDGDLGGADLALAQITINEARATKLDFSDAYFVDQAGVVVRPGDEVSDLKTAREQRWAVQRGTTELDLIDEVIRPNSAPVLFDDVVTTIDAVGEGRASAALVDLTTALVSTKGRADVTTAAMFLVDGEIGIAMPMGTANVEVIDAALHAFENEGVLDDLEADFLHPIFEQDPASIPVIRGEMSAAARRSPRGAQLL